MSLVDAATDNGGSCTRLVAVAPFVVLIAVSVLFEDLFVKLAVKFHKRTLVFLSIDCDEDVNITVFFTTLDIIDELLNDAELRTFGDAVILMGTVHEALNDADRCTGSIVRVAEFGGAEDGATWVSSILFDANEWSGNNFSGGNVDDNADRAGDFVGVVTDVELLMAINFLGDGVHELSLC